MTLRKYLAMVKMLAPLRCIFTQLVGQAMRISELTMRTNKQRLIVYLNEMNFGGDKSHQDTKNEAFEKVMYGDETLDSPQGFGFGVRKSNIYGVQGMLRKAGYGNFHKVPMEVRNDFKAEISALSQRNEVLEKKSKDLQSKV